MTSGSQQPQQPQQQQQQQHYAQLQPATLHMHPEWLEARFWSADSTQRMLCVLDCFAFAMVLPNLAAAMLGRVQSLPAGVQLPLGARLILVVYWTVSMLPIALMLLNFGAYKRHRTQLAVASRLYRLVASALLTHPATVLGYVTQVEAVRSAALAGDTTIKAVLINTLLPTVLHMQQANCHLPIRLAVWFQLGCFGVAVLWAQGMPCWLPLPTNVGGSTSAIPCSSSSSNATMPGNMTSMSCQQQHGAALAAFQQAGSTACQGLQAINALIMPVASAPLLQLCQGAAAFQLLFLFAAAMLLLVVVLSSVYLVERAAKLHWLHKSGYVIVEKLPPMALPWQEDDVAHGGVSSEAEAHGNQQAANGQQQRQQRQRQPRDTCRWFQPPSFPWHSGLHLPRYMLLLAPFTYCWLLSEALTQWLGSSCAPLLGAKAFDWMSPLF